MIHLSPFIIPCVPANLCLGFFSFCLLFLFLFLEYYPSDLFTSWHSVLKINATFSQRFPWALHYFAVRPCAFSHCTFYLCLFRDPPVAILCRNICKCMYLTYSSGFYVPQRGFIFLCNINLQLHQYFEIYVTGLAFFFFLMNELRVWMELQSMLRLMWKPTRSTMIVD